jgi:hypothetical protein
METSLNNFHFANHSQKQQKAVTFLMLSTVISVLMICHKNHASASARTVLPVRRPERICRTSHTKEPWAWFTHCFLHREALISKSVVPEVQKVLDKMIKMINYIKSRLLQSRLFSALCSAMKDTRNSYYTRKWDGYLEGRCSQGSVKLGKSSKLFSCLKILSWLPCLVMRAGAVKDKWWINSVIWKCWQGYENLIGGKDPTLAWQVDSPPWQCPCAWCVKSLQVPGQEIGYKNGPSTSFIWLSPLRFLALSKIKKCRKGTKICWHSWHPMHCDIIARYSGKRFSRLFPAVAPLFHKVHSFIRRVFWRRQRPLVHK